LIPAVTKGEAFEDALLRLRRSINGGGGAGGGVDDDDDDSDLEVITESITVTLRCPVRLPCCGGTMSPVEKYLSLIQLFSPLLIWVSLQTRKLVIYFLSLSLSFVVTKFEDSFVPLIGMHHKMLQCQLLHYISTQLCL